VNRDIILLPSLLIASGFECLSTREVKFLNNFRKHLDRSKYDLEEIFMVTTSDFELGGIMNPYNEFGNVSQSMIEYRSLFSSYPYLSRLQIKTSIYEKELEEIVTNLEKEIISDFERLQKDHHPLILHSMANSSFTVATVKALQNHLFYQKAIALHLCGIGDILLDTFNYILDKYLKRAS
jgi:hypothetical protein